MIDLHVHSNYSDGLYTPARVMEIAARDGLTSVALCDHDCILGLSEAQRRAKELDIEFIPGIELTINRTEEKDNADEVHMVGLFVKPTPRLKAIHTDIKKEQDAFAYDLAASIRKHLGLPVNVDDMRSCFHGAITMGAFGEYMLQKGMIDTFAERKAITERLIAEGKLHAKPEFGISAREAIDAIHEAGGLAILAHPYRMKLPDQVLFEKIKRYKAMGLDGLECYYTHYRKNSIQKIQKSLQMASVLGLLISGGSDYHKDTPQGRFQNDGPIPDFVLNDLKKAQALRDHIKWKYFGKPRD